MNKLRINCLIGSFFAHMLFISIADYAGHISFFKKEIPRPINEKLMLRFVESPEELPSEKIKKDLKDFSNKATEAKDNKEVKEKQGAKAEEVLEEKQLKKQARSNIETQKADSEESIDKEKKIEEQAEGKELVPIKDKVGKTQENLMPSDTEGDDIIRLKEISDDIFSAKYKGEFTFEVSYNKIGEYFKGVKRKIENYWIRYLLFKYPNTAPQKSMVKVLFKILPDGTINGAEVVEFFGDELFRDFCLSCVTNTAPFPALPEDVEEEILEEGGLEIIFTFRYK